MPKTVLIVEDTPDLQEMMKFLVESYGYDVILASDGREAVDRATAHKPDLILMDLMMPEMDGLESTQIIRSLSSNQMPIIALTAFRDYDQQAFVAGCTAVLYKPLDFSQLRSVIHKYLGEIDT